LGAGARGSQHRRQDVSGPVDGRPLAADPQLLAVEPDDHRNEGFERAQILVVISAEA
jgi:hypothetical protein